jgi:hypothetical protein
MRVPRWGNGRPPTLNPPCSADLILGRAFRTPRRVEERLAGSPQARPGIFLTFAMTKRLTAKTENGPVAVDNRSDSTGPPLARREYLSQNLDRRLPTTDGGTLATIGQAVNYMTAMGKQREARQHWQRAAKLILSKSDVRTVSRALELALFKDARLDVSKFR